MTRFEKDGWQQWKPSTSVKTKIWLRLDFFKNSQTYLIPLDYSYPRICLWCHQRYFTQFSIPLYLTWKQRFLNFFPRRSLAQCRIIACDLISAKLWLSHRWQVDYKSEDPTSVLKNSSSWVNAIRYKPFSSHFVLFLLVTSCCETYLRPQLVFWKPRAMFCMLDNTQEALRDLSLVPRPVRAIRVTSVGLELSASSATSLTGEIGERLVVFGVQFRLVVGNSLT